MVVVDYTAIVIDYTMVLVYSTAIMVKVSFFRCYSPFTKYASIVLSWIKS